MPQNRRQFIDHEKLRSLLAAGTPSNEIARRLNVTPSGVCKYLKRNGLKAASRGTGGIERIRPLAAKGMTTAEIAQRIGCSSVNVRNLARRYKVKVVETPREHGKRRPRTPGAGTRMLEGELQDIANLRVVGDDEGDAAAAEDALLDQQEEEIEWQLGVD
jgi:DNA-binding CsgD family transcriptional regulator